MRKFEVLMLLVWSTSTLCQGQDRPLPQCVRVLVEDKNGRSSGSGAYVESLRLAECLVVTCYHNIKDRKTDDVEILFPNWQLISGSVVKVDRRLDVAIIQLAQTPTCKPLPVSTDLTAKLTIHGYGYGPYKQQTGSLGTAGKWRKVIGAAARSGDSGGPVINERGEFVGVLWGSVDGETYFTPEIGR
jgi:S1-C subfamily serine protease